MNRYLWQGWVPKSSGTGLNRELHLFGDTFVPLSHAIGANSFEILAIQYQGTVRPHVCASWLKCPSCAAPVENRQVAVSVFDFRLVELAWDNANNRTGSSNHEKPHNSNAGQVRSDPVSASGAAVISRLQFTTGAGHRRGRARQTRPMRSRRPPCHRRQRSRRALIP